MKKAILQAGFIDMQRNSRSFISCRELYDEQGFVFAESRFHSGLSLYHSGYEADYEREG